MLMKRTRIMSEVLLSTQLRFALIFAVLTSQYIFE